MANIFAGLEALDNVETVDFSMEDMTEELIDLNMLNDEYEDTNADLNDTTARFESVFTAMDDIEHLMNVIETHGISKSLMAHADPAGYLVEKLGIPSVEMLDATPINDANAQAALEGFKETMKKWGEAIKKFFKMIWEKMKALFDKVVQMFSRHESILKKLKARLSEMSIDDKKAKDKKIKCLSAADLSKFGKELAVWSSSALGSSVTDALTAACNGADPQAAIEKILAGFATHAAVVGLKLNAEKNGFETVDPTYAKSATEGSVSEHGYSTSQCGLLVGEAIKFTAYTRSVPKLLKAIQGMGTAAVTHLRSLDKAEGTKSAKLAVTQLKRVAGVANKYIVATLAQIRRYISLTIMASNAVVACKK